MATALAPEPIQRLLGDQPTTLRMLEKIEAEDSLRSFIELMWERLEPGRTFISGWAIDAICEHLEAVTQGDLKRLVINVPPGCMKSLTTDVFWPAWEWGPQNRPSTRYVCASYSEALTIRDNRKCRNLIVGDKYQEFWGDRFKLMHDQNAKMKFETDATGFKLATSVGGLGTGERGDRFIIDDPHNVKDGESEAKRESALQWFTEVVPTRINDPEESAIIVIMQRVHERDVSGLILKEALNYEWLCLPMEYEPQLRCFTSVPREEKEPEQVCKILKEGEALPKWVTPEEYLEAGVPPDHQPEWEMLYAQDQRTEDGELLWPDRFSARYLEDELKPSLRAWGGTYAEAGQLQQRPAPRGGGMFQRQDFQYLDACPEGGRWVRGWDFVGSKGKRSPYTVGVKIGIVEGRVIVADVRRKKTTPGELDAMIKAVADADGMGRVIQDIPQDPGQSGKHQVMSIVRLLHGHHVHKSPETGSKPDRAKPFAAQCEAGNVWLVRAPWNDAYINELCIFPAGDFKDQADATSRGYQRLLAQAPMMVGAAPIAFGGETH